MESEFGMGAYNLGVMEWYFTPWSPRVRPVCVAIVGPQQAISNIYIEEGEWRHYQGYYLPRDDGVYRPGVGTTQRRDVRFPFDFPVFNPPVWPF